ARFKQLPKVSGARQVVVSAALRQIIENAETEAERLQDQYVSTEHLLLAMVDPAVSQEAGRILREAGATREAIYHALLSVRGGEIPGAREVRPRSDRSRAQGKARSGDRARRGDPARDPGALEAHEEQSRADRRARRGKDRDRRGARAEDRERRRAGGAQGPPRGRARSGGSPRRRAVPRAV